MEKETRKGPQPKLGEVLVQYGLITSNMLKNALRRQGQVGGQLGSILIDMGYINPDTLLEFMSKKFGVPWANLYEMDIPKSVLDTLPLQKMKDYKVVPLEDKDKYILGMVNPNDFVALKDVEFIVGKRVQPVLVPSSQIDLVLKKFIKEGIKEIIGKELEKNSATMVHDSVSDIGTLLKLLIETGARELQLTAGVPPSLRRAGYLERLNMPPMLQEQLSDFSKSLMTEDQQKTLAIRQDIDFAYTHKEYGRFRINIYKQRNSLSLAIRHLPYNIPSLQELGLPAELENFTAMTQGLILFSSPSGQGKSTTMASVVDIINTKRKCNIITLEEPIEFLHQHKNSNVNQREIGLDTPSYQDGLKHIFRQGPDVIVIGEMRDPESFRIALQAAETGHLVLSTVHTSTATSTIERIIDNFPAEHQPMIRNQLADVLLMILSQRLVPKKDGTGVVLAYERLLNTSKIKNFIREGRTHQIRSQMQIPGEEYSCIDASLAELCTSGKVVAQEAVRHADNEPFFNELVRKRSGR